MSENYLDYFCAAVQQNLQDMAGLETEISSQIPQLGVFVSSGLAVILGITGQRPGRVILDTNWATAKELSKLINGEETVDDDLTLDTMSELGNIISGNAITKANNSNKGMGLMLTPPSLFFGSKLSIVSPRLKAEFIGVKTPVGELVLSVGFEGGK